MASQLARIRTEHFADSHQFDVSEPSRFSLPAYGHTFTRLDGVRPNGRASRQIADAAPRKPTHRPRRGGAQHAAPLDVDALLDALAREGIDLT